MTVSVAAGDAVVDMDSGSFNGRYFQKNDAAVVVTVGAAHATLPRIDQIILTINDSTVSGASDTPTLSCLAGTATSGATLDNRTGAAGLPRNSVRLADVLVPAASINMVAGNIRVRRPWARGALRRIGRTGGDYRIATSTITAIDATNVSPRIECSGAPLLVSLKGVVDTAGYAALTFDLALDGVQVAASERVWFTSNFGGSSAPSFVHFDWDVTPAAGSHLITPRWRSTGVSFTFFANATRGLGLRVQELPIQDAENT
jgi:hypothetical protein